MGGNQEVDGLTDEMKATLEWVTSVNRKAQTLADSRGGYWSVEKFVDVIEELALQICELQDQLTDIVGEDPQ